VHQRALQHTKDELLSKTVGMQDPTPTPHAFEGCYFWLAAAWSCGLTLSVSEVCQLCTCRESPEMGHPKPRVRVRQAEQAQRMVTTRGFTSKGDSRSPENTSLSFLLTIPKKQPAHACKRTERCAETC